MKKIALISVLTIFLVAILCVGASAEDTTFVLSAENVTVFKGDSELVAMDITVDQNPGIWGFQFEFSVDTRYMTLDSYETDGLAGDFSVLTNDSPIGKTSAYTEIYNVQANGNSVSVDSVKTGTIITLYFRLKDDVPTGVAFPVKLTPPTQKGSFWIDIAMNDVPYTLNNGSITVAKEETIKEKDEKTGEVIEYYVVNGEKSTETTLARLDDGREVYVENGIVKNSGTGLVKKASNNRWYFIKDGVFTSATGVAQRVDGSNKTWYFVLNGVYTTKTGVAQRADGSNKTWYFVLNGIYTKNSGLAQRADGSNTTWYYVKNGAYLSTAKGVAQRADKSNTTWYYVLNGKYTKNTGVAQRADGSNKTWYFVLKGVYTKNSGLAQRADKSNTTWYYVKNGAYLSTAKGVAQRADKSNTAWYYVQAGKYTKNTGIAQRADKSNTNWYYVKNGVYTKGTGLAKKADGSSSTWYYVKNGVFTKSTLIVKFNNANRYVKAGVWQSGFSGKVKIGTKTYTIKKGNVV